MKFIRSVSTLFIALLLSAAAFADDLTRPGDPESLGFSAERLARITAWRRARADAITPSDPVVPGAVVAIARDGDLLAIGLRRPGSHERRRAARA